MKAYNTDLPKRFQTARKYFKIPAESHQIHNVIYDHGFGYSFPSKPITTQIPAGTYQVGYTRDHDFILSKTSKVNRIDSNESIEDLLMELNGFIDEKEVDKNQFKNVAHEKSYGFMGRGYFPLHEYNSSLNSVYEELILFLNNKEFYQKSELGFKRSVLLYGDTGVGKSRFLDWFSKSMIKELDAIVIRLNNSDDIDRLNSHGLNTLNRVAKNRLIIFLIEELSSLVGYRQSHLGLLNLLDNPILRDNVLFLSTTNNPEKIPANIIARQQRLDVLAEVNPKDNSDDFVDAFYEFVFQEEFPPKYKTSEWYEKPLTPAALKELFIYAQMHQVDLDASYQKIKERERLVKDNFDSRDPVGFSLFDE
ncbi:AAA family ATPase [Gracilimonas sp. Q87]|uniref:AAA family ATPase n=1 Tax=Gracilimonas sp. Q87 TaxID=3384766 RepID=UPI003984244F